MRRIEALIFSLVGILFMSIGTFVTIMVCTADLPIWMSTCLLLAFWSFLILLAALVVALLN